MRAHGSLESHSQFVSLLGLSSIFVASCGNEQQVDGLQLFQDIDVEDSVVILLQSFFTHSQRNTSGAGSVEASVALAWKPPKDANITELGAAYAQQKLSALFSVVGSTVLFVGIGIVAMVMRGGFSHKSGTPAASSLLTHTFSDVKKRPPLKDLTLRPVTEDIKQQCEERPTAIALTYWIDGCRKELSYSDFWLHVSSLRNGIAARAKPGELVVLCLDRGVHQVLMIYAIMASGVAWVPVDPATPRKRIEQILEDTKATLFLYQSSAEDALLIAKDNKVPSLEIPIDIFYLSSGMQSLEAPPAIKVTLEAKAVIFYTSGSSGKPKGVVYSHAHLAHGVKTFANDMQLDWDSVGLYKTPYIWAVAEYELFPALMNGGRLVVAEALGHKDPIYMAGLVKSEKVTTLCSTAKVLDILMNVHDDSAELESLKDVLSVGEALPVSVANRFLQTEGITARLHNCYGASETGTTLYTLPSGGLQADAKLKMVPAGSPQAGVIVHVLDEQGHPVASGTGEICLGGPLSDGYWGNPELTKEKFRVHPEYGRLYHTGDIGSWSGDVLHVSGRVDRQVKIRGVRVEVEEVEAVIAERKVDLCFSGFAVVATTSEQPELVAIIVPVVDKRILDTIEEHCKSSLPVAYLPSHFLSLPEMPQLPNGKNDLGSLTSIATKHSQSDQLEETMDSLGLMKKMSKHTLEENAVIQRCYTLWMFSVIIGHWGSCGINRGSNGCVTMMQSGVYPSVELFFRTISNDSTMMGFILCGAWQDSSTPRVRLGIQDVVIASAFVVNAVFLGSLLQTLFSEKLFESYVPFHNWYLLMIVWARCSIRALQGLGLPSSLQVLVQVALAAFLPSKMLHVAEQDEHIWSYAMHDPGASMRQWKFRLFPYDGFVYLRWIQNYVALYVLAFHYLRPSVEFLRPKIRNFHLGPCCALASFGLSIVLGAIWAVVHYPSPGLNSDKPDVMVLLDISIFFGICALVCFAMAWLPVSCKWPGSTTLGTYMVHFYLVSHWEDNHYFIFGNLLDFASRVPSGVAQVLIIAAWPLLFTVLIGPCAHYVLIVGPQFLVRRAYSKFL